MKKYEVTEGIPVKMRKRIIAHITRDTQYHFNTRPRCSKKGNQNWDCGRPHIVFSQHKWDEWAGAPRAFNSIFFVNITQREKIWSFLYISIIISCNFSFFERESLKSASLKVVVPFCEYRWMSINTHAVHWPQSTSRMLVTVVMGERDIAADSSSSGVHLCLLGSFKHLSLQEVLWCFIKDSQAQMKERMSHPLFDVWLTAQETYNTF